MPGVASASQLVQFDLAGIAVSAGSACSSGAMKASPVLAAMEVPAEVANSFLRISFGPHTADADIERFTAEWFGAKMTGWESAINHYLRTGQRLTAAAWE